MWAQAVLKLSAASVRKKLKNKTGGKRSRGKNQQSRARETEGKQQGKRDGGEAEQGKREGGEAEQRRTPRKQMIWILLEVLNIHDVVEDKAFHPQYHEGFAAAPATAVSASAPLAGLRTQDGTVDKIIAIRT